MAENYELTSWDLFPVKGYEWYEKRMYRDMKSMAGDPRRTIADCHSVRREYEKRAERLAAYNLALLSIGAVVLFSGAVYLADKIIK
ncbi:MAG: hypothetical protein HY513_02300 [Candidatus Aenigmarchaeota archaeon]|nr:hypothetical protein [Candidatus Aenigmarchaeota archaeon]